MHVAVRRYQLWRFAEQAQMILQARFELSFITRVALQYPEPAYDAPSTSESHTFLPNSVLLRALPLQIMAVCSSKMESSFSLAETCSASNTLRWVCETARLVGNLF